MTWLPDGYGRRFSAAGDQRERAVRCQGAPGCRVLTWAIDGVCDTHHADECDCGTDGDGVPLCSPDASAETWAVDA